MMGNGSIELPCTPKEESRIVRDLLKKDESNLQEGNTYYLVSTRWYVTWQKYTGQPVGFLPYDEHPLEDQSSTSAERPGPIDNSDLVSSDHDPQLLRTVEEGCNYVLLPEEAWGRLYEWYEGGPAIARKMITVGCKKQLVVEVFPLCLNLVDSRDNSHSLIQLSKKASLNELYEAVCQLKGLEREKVLIFDYFNQRKLTLLVDSNETLEDSNLLMDHHILLELKDDQFRSSNMNSSSANVVSYSNMDKCEHETRQNRGLAGLQNLGNTCFMNSSLQCLAHTPPMMQYFLQDYSDEINKENPLGMRGELALAFGTLLRNLWSSGETSVPPRKFKQQLSRFAPQFSGYNQHDSQELLAFLLDGLHEDLNRVKQKPYIETKDSNGRGDEEVADEYWMYHKARNDSIIVDVCQGQYKSTLVCPSCSKISVTFDPFMYLSLPLPLTATRAMTVAVFHGDGTALPVEITVTVPKHGSCQDLITALATGCSLSADDEEYLLLAEVCGRKVLKYFEKPSKELLKSIKNRDRIVAYRLPKSSIHSPKLEITHRYLQKPDHVLTPLVTFLEDPRSSSDVNQAVHRVLAPFRKNCSAESSETEEPGMTTFHLYSKCKPMNFNVRTVKVALDWTEKEDELYDASLLKGSPQAGLNDIARKTEEEDVSLFSCLDAFLKEEPLEPDNMWYCPDCKEHRQATKKLDLWRLPDVLVFHLKRFSYSRWRKDKLDTFVNFPVRGLDLSDYVGGTNRAAGHHVYELYAVSNHYGGLGSGHYSAYCKLIDDDNKWYHFDDSHVSNVDENDIATPAAYVLFYRRVASKSNATAYV